MGNELTIDNEGVPSGRIENRVINWCLKRSDNAVIARSEATWQSPGYSEMSEKRTNALTNCPELLGDCHDQSADWSRNDSSNERSNTNLPGCRVHLTAVFNHSGRGYRNAPMSTFNSANPPLWETRSRDSALRGISPAGDHFAAACRAIFFTRRSSLTWL